MTNNNLVWQFCLTFALALLLGTQLSTAQPINEQKKAVVFIFGTIHPLNPDKTPITDANGQPVAVDAPIGTGFFVGYPDRRGGPNYRASYLVTAKHVLRDVDGTFLRNITIRLNLKLPVGDSGVGFIRDIPVIDAQGVFLWLHSDDEAQDIAILPLFPDDHEFEFTTVSTRTFLSDQALASGGVAEGDDLYFIGLMAQYYGIKRNYLLVRRGTLALLTDEYIETSTGRQEVFIGELESWPGNSGSPVFLMEGRRETSPAEGNNSSLFGVIVGSFLNRFTVPLNGQTAQQLQAGDQANTGITAIVPAKLIQKILISEPAQQDRDARIRSLHRGAK